MTLSFLAMFFFQEYGIPGNYTLLSKRMAHTNSAMTLLNTSSSQGMARVLFEPNSLMESR